MAKKKRKGAWKAKWKAKVFLLVTMGLVTQYLAAHITGWSKMPYFNMMDLGTLWQYIMEQPFDVTSYDFTIYAGCYLIALLIFVLMVCQTPMPHADMKGEEHGSNDFMSQAEIAEFKQTRITPDFEYSESVIKAASYPQSVLSKWRKKR